MEQVKEVLICKTAEYFKSIDELSGIAPDSLLVDYVVEKYIQHRNFPDNFSEEKVLKDIKNHMATIVMGIVEVYLKRGAEGETSHSENGVVRNYDSAPIVAFKDVIPFVKIL